MIEIKQNNIVLYTVPDFTYVESLMGDATITLKLSIPLEMKVLVLGDAEVDIFAPKFALDYYVEHNGEQFFLITSQPQATKDISALSYNYDLVFDSRRSELKRRLVKDLATLGIDTYISKGVVFTLYADITIFAKLIQDNLKDSFGESWDIVVNPAILSSVTQFVSIEVNNSYIWDILLKTFELYGLRWKIESVSDIMTIRIGYDAPLVSGVPFEYGSATGLTKITRIISDTKIINRLRGTAGSKNLPVNYFKSTAAGYSNGYTGFPNDEDALHGSFFFKNLMPYCFRESVRQFNIDGVTPLVDYVTILNIPESAIIEAALVPNEDIYPSIEGVYIKADGSAVTYTDPTAIGGIGRIDEIVAVEASLFDDRDYKAGLAFAGTKCQVDNYAVTGQFNLIAGVQEWVSYTPISVTKSVNTDVFTLVDKNLVANLHLSYIDQYENTKPPLTPDYVSTFTDKLGVSRTISGTILEFSATVDLMKAGVVVNSQVMGLSALNTDLALEYKDLLAGDYSFRITSTCKGNLTADNHTLLKWSVVGEITGIKNVTGIYKPTFNIWVKDIQFDLADVDSTGLPIYASTEDGKVSFKSGMLAGYEFTILKSGKTFACVVDTTKPNSKYRITLIKSDVEYQAGKGYMLPSTVVYPVIDDQFILLGINLPHSYVITAEQRLQTYLEAQLEIAHKLYPTYTIEILDSFLQANPNIKVLLRAGNTVKIRDKRLTDGDLTLYINTVTVTNAGLLPKYSITVTDKVTVNGSTVQRISAQINALAAGQFAGQQSNATSLANLDNRYLRKTAEDTSYEEITFKGGLKASTIKTEDFEQGQFGGSGLGVFKDAAGNTVLEVDKLAVRKEAWFNEVVINQIRFQGGIMVYSAANMEVSKVERDDHDSYVAYFDTKGSTVFNQFEVGDVIRCQRWVSGAQVKYYMSVVRMIGLDFIVIDPSLSDGIIDIAIGDMIVQYGSVSNVLRQSVIVMDVLNGGKQTFYQGLGAGLQPFSTTDKNMIDIGMVDNETMLRVYGNMFVGSRPDDLIQSYIKFTKGATDVDPLLEIRAKVEFQSADGTFKDVADIKDAGYLTEAITKGSSSINGGLVLGNVLAVKDLAGNITAGINGLKNAAYRFWSGHSDPEQANFSVSASGWLKALKGFIGLFNISDGKIIGRDTSGAERLVLSTTPVSTISQLGGGNVAIPADLYGNKSTNPFTGSDILTTSASIIIPIATTITFDFGQSSIDFLEPQFVSDVVVVETVNIWQGGVKIATSTTGIITLSASGGVVVEFVTEVIATVLTDQDNRPLYTTLIMEHDSRGITYMAASSKTELGSDGLLSFWGANNYMRYTQAGGLEIKGNTDVSGVLATGSLVGGSHLNMWGAKKSNLDIEYIGAGIYRVHHAVGNQNYTVIVTTEPFLSGDVYFPVISSVRNKQNESFDVYLMGDDTTRRNVNFDYTIFGSN